MMSLFVSRAAVLMRRFGRNRRGSAAIEFALIAPIFFGLLFAIIEVALMFFAGQVLETAVQDSARLILTGQAQGGSFSQSKFRDDVCGRLGGLFTCSGVFVDVQSYGTDFSKVDISPPIDANKNFVDNMKYAPGQAGDVVVVRAFYQWPLFVTGLGYNVANLSGSKRLLTATAAFRNEPYSN
ncbi:TadE/TadG family type IV pilus assembly protein [Rhodopseudomonas pseudopalustris]|uniref:Flp pilus assembly protein TadG n=1 Tax=Rhodopseudomonas pseudopalustris TaxID=1513892 RepID=A0A1H8QQH3_9BRAD|nr:TadE/TadG family type IV pilus assembly protein [Rhodopseudomonas pseudopalustris]SEO56073.1 Flp pilus assembly protein TadG [Rhodopseudomonas pseudopalustris]